VSREIPELRVALGSPEPRAVAVVVRGDKLLVMARRLDGREYAVLPGGGIEPGETPAEAAVRELGEECSLDGTVARHLFDGDHGGRPASYFLLDVPDGEPVLGGPEALAQSEDDHYQPLWVTARELPLLGLLPDGIEDLVAAAVWPFRVEVAGPDDWPVIEHLWQLYQHDLSEFRHGSPGPDGLFQARRLPAYRDRDDRIAYLARLGDVPCGFALVRLGMRLDRRTMGEFFVTRSARGQATATAFAGAVLARHPGTWVVPFQNENPRAAAFWRRLAGDLLEDVSETTAPVPGKSHLPDDVWLSGILVTSGQSRG
jgi:predicted acetyltransferase/ADP-ribose pyrophosphatase YjhB (NUDIX family)